MVHGFFFLVHVFFFKLYFVLGYSRLLMLLNCVGEDFRYCKEIKPVNPQGNQS